MQSNSQTNVLNGLKDCLGECAHVGEGMIKEDLNKKVVCFNSGLLALYCVSKSQMLKINSGCHLSNMVAVSAVNSTVAVSAANSTAALSAANSSLTRCV